MISTGTGIAPFASLVRDPGHLREVRRRSSSPTPAATSAELAYGVELFEQPASTIR